MQQRGAVRERQTENYTLNNEGGDADEGRRDYCTNNRESRETELKARYTMAYFCTEVSIRGVFGPLVRGRALVLAFRWHT